MLLVVIRVRVGVDVFVDAGNGVGINILVCVNIGVSIDTIYVWQVSVDLWQIIDVEESFVDIEQVRIGIGEGVDSIVGVGIDMLVGVEVCVDVWLGFGVDSGEASVDV